MKTGDLIINRYLIKRILGQGAMGRVYLAYDKIAQIDVALKMISPEISVSKKDMQAIRKNFRLIHRLHHPRIAAVRQLEYIAATGEYFIVMEYVDGDNLKKYCISRPERVLSAKEAIRICRQVAQGLDYAHQHGVIHRDIKPENIMITSNGEVKLLDFGLAIQTEASLKQSTANLFNRCSQKSSTYSPFWCGTAAYIAPETWQCRKPSRSIDIYALGVVFYELVSGWPPFYNSDLLLLRQTVLNDSPQTLEFLPLKQNQVLAKVLAKKKEERFASALEFTNALQDNFAPKPFKYLFYLALLLILGLTVLGDQEPRRLSSKSTSSMRLSTLRVVTNPSNARIEFIGKKKKFSQGMKIQSGAWQIKLSVFGYKPKVIWVVVDPAKDIVLYQNLEPLAKGRLRIVSTPLKTNLRLTDLTLNFERYLQLPMEEYKDMQLPVGTYKLEAQTAGYYAKQLQVSIIENRFNHVKIELFPVEKRTNHLGLRFNYIPKGAFFMGSPPGEAARDIDEVQHNVRLTKGFYMSQTEVTVGQFRRFVAASGYRTEAERDGGAYIKVGPALEKMAGYNWKTPGFDQTDDHPVTCISYTDAQKFINWLNTFKDKKYRLPTEAEWEYAARAGGSATGLYSDPDKMCLYANVADRSVSEKYPDWPAYGCRDKFTYTAPVKTYLPNGFGLYDMTGNVWEWCQDGYADYSKENVTDPKGPSWKENKVIRGGSWRNDLKECRVANRLWNAKKARNYITGFRLVQDR